MLWRRRTNERLSTAESRNERTSIEPKTTVSQLCVTEKRTGKPLLRLPCLSAARAGSNRDGEDRMVLLSSSCLPPGRLFRLVHGNSQRYSNTKRTFLRTYVGIRQMRTLDHVLRASLTSPDSKESYQRACPFDY